MRSLSWTPDWGVLTPPISLIVSAPWQAAKSTSKWKCIKWKGAIVAIPILEVDYTIKIDLTDELSPPRRGEAYRRYENTDDHLLNDERSSDDTMATPREQAPAERPNATRRLRARRKRRRDRTEVSCCVKWVVFSQNVLFWIVGLLIFAAGIWAWTEKDTLNNLKRLTSIAVDPAFLLIITGLVTFVIGFTGCVGALRENTFLLAVYSFLLGIILLCELVLGILGFVFRDWLRGKVKEILQALISDYREDEDAMDLVNWIQGYWLQCCGITSPGDWNNNIYFNCSAPSSPEACGVPYSCCRPPKETSLPNLQCGYGVRRKDDFSELIYNKGCLDAAQSWFDQNLVIVAAVAIGVAVVQILGICFGQNLRADILAQKAKWARYK
ncbi:Tetraspanin-5 [Hypsibius exemplaris]|uniref:Tetraspanin-5 n=1 Tax=Hypsibius exemplaris TaxID=2072580 RepID=A0A1W0WPG0_HYPEX|nr:Tetraspanin-5 [Hypsibius exemplaris]